MIKQQPEAYTRTRYLQDVIDTCQEQMKIYGTQTKTHFVAEYALQAARAELLALEGPAMTITSIEVDIPNRSEK